MQVNLPPDVMQLSPLALAGFLGDAMKVIADKQQAQIDMLQFEVDTLRGVLNIATQGIEAQDVHKAMADFTAQRLAEQVLLALPCEIILNDMIGRSIIRAVVREDEGKAMVGLIVIDGDFKHLHGKQFKADTPQAAIEAAKGFVQEEAEKLGQKAQEAQDG